MTGKSLLPIGVTRVTGEFERGDAIAITNPDGVEIARALVGLDSDEARLVMGKRSDAVVDLLETITAPNRIKRALKSYDPAKRLIYQARGAKLRALFDRDALPRREQMIRNTLKREGLWLR